MTNQNAGIIGMGHAYPSGILTNADLEKIVETSDDWITSRTGIKQRHKARDDEYTSQFGSLAAKQAVERAGIDVSEIDLIVCATTTPDQIMPSTGALIQAQIGAVNAAGMDIFAACSGFLYGLTMVESMIRTGQVQYCIGDRSRSSGPNTSTTPTAERASYSATAPGQRARAVPEGKAFWLPRSTPTPVRNQLFAPGGAPTRNNHQTIADGQHFFKMRGN